ncbi:MAG: hypothetical protein JXO49_10695 [Deltaproteobacteria bacterium]|nr:hypothetical protein [Candidatus Anaeroferrophillus wilburensis]MBN2889800.1 hypothetical protein [Deltaproteobacteria bacterium]
MEKPCSDDPQSSVHLLCRIVRQLFHLDELVHVLVALTLVIIALCILGHTVVHFKSLDIHSLLKAVNMVLLVLIVMEILWPVLTFLKKDPFTLNPFIYVCIISSIRRILLVEAEMSIGHYDHKAYALEIGISVGTIFVMTIVHYIYNKGYVLEQRCALPETDEKQ